MSVLNTVTQQLREESIAPIMKGLLIVISVWLGVSFLYSGQSDIQGWLLKSPLFEGGSVAFSWVPYVQGWIYIAAGFALLHSRLQRTAAWLLAAVFGFSLHFLFVNPVWVESYGGFPVIGAGQSMIKHVCLVALAVWVSGDFRSQAKYGGWFGIMLVLYWIGAMKFYAFEAEGIVGLMEPNIFFNWLYIFFDVQGASNVIGTFEVLNATLLLAIPFSLIAGRIGIVMVIITVLGTHSFIITTPGWDGIFPMLTRTGVFIVKDLSLLACALLLWQQGLTSSKT